MPERRFPGGAQPEAVDGVDTAIFDGEAVLFRESTCTIHHLGAIAGAVWMSCDGATSVDSMVAQLGDLFGTGAAQLAAPLATLVDDALIELAGQGLLADQGLLVDTACRPAAPPVTIASSAFDD